MLEKMIDQSYAVEFKLLDVLKALAEVASNSQDDAEWLSRQIKELEELLFGEVRHFG